MSDVTLEVNLQNDEITLVVDGPVQIVSNTGVQAFRFEQSTTSAAWTVNHNLNRPCNGQAFNLSGEQVACDVSKASLNTMRFLFAQPTAGFAEIS
jgi:hypothetical protein